MAETLLSQSLTGTKTLVEWRNPEETIIEWVLFDEELRWEPQPEMLFRWSRGPDELFPLTVKDHYFWSFDVGRIEANLRRLEEGWDRDDLFALWLEVGRGWYPSNWWTAEAWRNVVVWSYFPWITGLPRDRLEIPLELVTFFRAATIRDGLKTLGFRPVGTRLTELALHEVNRELALGKTGRLTLPSLLWAHRFAPFLPDLDLCRFWELPANLSDRDFLEELNRWQPQTAAKLKMAIKRAPRNMLNLIFSMRSMVDL